MSTVQTTPGLYFTVGAKPPEKSPLRSDIAAFVGQTRRGRVGVAVRVEGWRGYLREFGGLTKDAAMPYAIRGYFENGGELAYVVRLAKLPPPGLEPDPNNPQPPASSTVAGKDWDLSIFEQGKVWDPLKGGFLSYAYRIEATSPGYWANSTHVSIRYRREGPLGKPEVDVIVQAPDEPIEYLIGLDPSRIKDQIAASSNLIRLTSLTEEVGEPEPPGPAVPRRVVWKDIVLSGGVEVQAAKYEYLDAIQKLGDEVEVALLAMPDLYYDTPVKNNDLSAKEKAEVLRDAIQQAEDLRDRLVLVDLPADKQDTTEAIQWVGESLRNPSDPRSLRAAAVYHPRLWVPDPLGGINSPLLSIPPSGHVAGVISYLDRNRGAHHTPANATVEEAVDIIRTFDLIKQGLLIEQGINLVRCTHGQGLQVWGGRTLSDDLSGRFIAHRRLIHRLVRAIHRVADPLVFDTNGPELWLTIVRAITTLLLESYNAGALKGARPEEAFRVRCDATTTPPEEQELGRVFCLIDLAPAVPMEFITIRVVMGTDATLEVFES